jgi:hypothetical protein
MCTVHFAALLCMYILQDKHSCITLKCYPAGKRYGQHLESHEGFSLTPDAHSAIYRFAPILRGGDAGG